MAVGEHRLAVCAQSIEAGDGERDNLSTLRIATLADHPHDPGAPGGYDELLKLLEVSNAAVPYERCECDLSLVGSGRRRRRVRAGRCGSLRGGTRLVPAQLCHRVAE